MEQFNTQRLGNMQHCAKQAANLTSVAYWATFNVNGTEIIKRDPRRMASSYKEIGN